MFFIPFKKGLNKHLKNIIYKYSLASRPAKNNCYILYSYILAPNRCNNSFKLITTPKIIKII